MGSVSTEGWDTIFALRLPEVNAEIARAISRGDGRLPDLNWAPPDGSAKLTASFGTWSLAADGAQPTGGTQVTMRLPVATGSFTFMKSPPQSLAGIILKAQVQLTALAGQQHALVVDSTRPVTITDIEASPPLPNPSI